MRFLRTHKDIIDTIEELVDTYPKYCIKLIMSPRGFTYKAKIVGEGFNGSYIEFTQYDPDRQMMYLLDLPFYREKRDSDG